jgi:hypothetical protein
MSRIPNIIGRSEKNLRASIPENDFNRVQETLQRCEEGEESKVEDESPVGHTHYTKSPGQHW